MIWKWIPGVTCAPFVFGKPLPSSPDLRLAQTRGAAAEFVALSGETIVGVSGEAAPMSPEMTAALMSVPKGARAKYLGQCAEFVCLERAIAAGIDVKGGRIRVVAVGHENRGNYPHGASRPPCPSCQSVLTFFEVSW